MNIDFLAAHMRFVAVIYDPTGFMPVGEESLVLWWHFSFSTFSSTDVPTLQEVGIGGRIGATKSIFAHFLAILIVTEKIGRMLL